MVFFFLRYKNSGVEKGVSEKEEEKDFYNLPLIFYPFFFLFANNKHCVTLKMGTKKFDEKKSFSLGLTVIWENGISTFGQTSYINAVGKKK